MFPAAYSQTCISSPAVLRALIPRTTNLRLAMSKTAARTIRVVSIDVSKLWWWKKIRSQNLISILHWLHCFRGKRRHSFYLDINVQDEKEKVDPSQTPNKGDSRCRVSVLFIQEYLYQKSHISAAVIVRNSKAVVTHPEERGIFQVYRIQHDQGDSKDSSKHIHEHSEANLRGKTERNTFKIRVILQHISYSGSSWLMEPLTRQFEGNCPAKIDMIPLTMNC